MSHRTAYMKLRREAKASEEVRQQMKSQIKQLEADNEHLDKTLARLCQIVLGNVESRGTEPAEIFDAVEVFGRLQADKAELVAELIRLEKLNDELDFLSAHAYHPLGELLDKHAPDRDNPEESEA